MTTAETLRYETAGGFVVERRSTTLPIDGVIEPLVDALDTQRGVLLTSTYEYPGRYTRWDIGFTDPPVVLTAKGTTATLSALNQRGIVILSQFMAALERIPVPHCSVTYAGGGIIFEVKQNIALFTEEQRSRQPSIFSILRSLIELLRAGEDAHLGFYGAFGYDLTFQFDPIDFQLPRDAEQRDLVLYLPDEILVVDRQRDVATRYHYDFTFANATTDVVERTTAPPIEPVLHGSVDAESDHTPVEYEQGVREAIDSFKRGDLFEVVTGQVFQESMHYRPSEVFRRLRARNPAPYGAFMNLGEQEFLIAASPEMFVRVEGRRVETCPIAGTIARGSDVISDSERIRELLNSEKDLNELTMCTDVDRNDKSRVCDPASIRVIGRRQIETYSRLFHTVDHVEGMLLPQFDAIDAFLTHTWAVTVTGAPKLWAMRFIEEHEKSQRRWYGGAIGAMFFNGNINTGLTLRTIRVKDGIAEVRAGATLLIDSDPAAEEKETRTKASALLDAVRNPEASPVHATPTTPDTATDHYAGTRILLVDHEDSFVHTLAGYLRRTGAEVQTVRVPRGKKLDPDVLNHFNPHILVLSPGPGSPSDFNLSHTLTMAEQAKLPVFGVCLGLQGMVEHFGGKLDTLSYPAHGRASKVTVTGGKLFDGLPQTFEAGRYHSLCADVSQLPDSLQTTATTDDGVIMAIEHRNLPVAAVQFHPESLMTMGDDVGMRLISNVMRLLTRR
jgi:anthranilate synthase